MLIHFLEFYLFIFGDNFLEVNTYLTIDACPYKNGQYHDSILIDHRKTLNKFVRASFARNPNMEGRL